MPARWEGDDRGRGVAGAEAGIADVDRLRSAMALRDWVAEDPDLHLLPHVERACDDNGWRIVLLEGEGVFAPHGHVVRLSLRAA